MKNLLLTLLLLTTSLLATQKPILKLDTKGHRGLIRDIIVTKEGDIISASEDKTIRVWSSDGVEKRKILGQIGAGNEGTIYAIALSDDERYLAVGGFLNNNGDKKFGNIRIYNYKTGKLLKVLKLHTNVVLDLSFKDNYLISGSSDETAKIWNIAKNFALQDSIKFHTKEVYAVKLLKKGNHYFAVTAGFDNKIELYDMQKKRVVSSHRLNSRLQFLAVSRNDIAVCGNGKEITIYNHNLEKIRTIKSETVPAGLAYSRDGRYLIAGAGANPLDVNIYNAKEDYSLHSSFKKHKNLTIAVAFLKQDGRLYGVSAGGNNNKIYIWDIDRLKVKTKIEGVSATVWSVGIKANSIAWGNVWTANYGQTKFQKSINLKNFQISTNTQNFHRIIPVNGIYFLSHDKGGKYGYSNAVLNIKRDGTTVAQITKGPYDGYKHNCYGWYKNYIVSGGANGFLGIYNREGVKVASLVGHRGEVWSIALEGDTLVSGSGDQTIKVWDLSQVNGVLKFDEHIIKIGMKKLNLSRKDVISFAIKNNLNIYKPQIIYPTLNIFVSKTNDYIVWSKSGYYTSSTGGR